jgi:molybdopterin-biosynthesis enzyme MoeA-like protein
VEALADWSLVLNWCRYIGDSPQTITRELRFVMETGDIVLCCGGIGATPDDHTRASAARAAGVALVRHPQAAAIIEERFGDSAYPQRIHMADLPEGCTLIPNPVNRVAGFSLGSLHFVPGFPQMAWPMMEWVLNNHYPQLRDHEPSMEILLTLPGVSEGQLIDIMQDFVARFPEVELSCLPHMEGDYRETELGVRGHAGNVDGAISWLTETLDRGGWRWNKRAASPAV